MARAVIALLACIAIGCAGFRAGRLEAIQSWPPPPSPEERPIRLLVKVRRLVNGWEGQPGADYVAQWRSFGALVAKRAYVDSGLFSSVSTAESPDGLTAEVEVVDHTRMNAALALLSHLTLLLIPSRTSQEITVTTVLLDGAGTRLATLTKSDTVTTWQQTFLIVLTPWWSPWVVTDETLYDLHRATIGDARARGVI